MTAPDTNDDLIARCQRRLVTNRVWWAYAEAVPALIAALTAAQAEIERLRAELANESWMRLAVKYQAEIERLSAIADTEKATSFKLRQELSDTLAEIEQLRETNDAIPPWVRKVGEYRAERDQYKAEVERLRAKVKQGDALAAAIGKIANSHWSSWRTREMLLAAIGAALAAWEDTPGGDGAS